MKNSDDILIKNCIKNNRKSQKELYDKYKDAMFTICLRITGNYDDAADALQDGFISVFKGLSSFKGESTFGAWIKTIMVRSSVRRLKKIFFVDEEKIHEEPVLFDSDLSGDDLHNAILQLDEGYRSIFVLYEVEGYTHNEIGEMLNISPGTSKSQLHYAKKKLKKILKKIYDYER